MVELKTIISWIESHIDFIFIYPSQIILFILILVLFFKTFHNIQQFWKGNRAISKESFESEEKDDWNYVFSNDYFQTIPITFPDWKNSEKNFTSTSSNNVKPILACHYYYLGSYYTGLVGGLSMGKVTEETIRQTIQKGIRVLHFKIEHSIDYTIDPSHPLATTLSNTPQPILIQPFATKIDREIVPWKRATEILRDYLWLGNKKNAPCFLYLDLSNTILSNTNYMSQVFEPLIDHFTNFFVPKKYGFNGRNGIYSIAHAPIDDVIGKMAIFCNQFPTATGYDEIIHGNFQKEDAYCGLDIYDKNLEQNGGYVLRIDNKEDFYRKSSQTMLAVAPEMKYNINATRAFSDIFQYEILDPLSFGISVLFMHIQYPVDNNRLDDATRLRKAYEIFSNRGMRLKPRTQVEYEQLTKKNDPVQSQLFWDPSPPPKPIPQNPDNALKTERIIANNGYMDIVI